MSIKINNAIFNTKKLSLNQIDLNVNSGEISNLILENNKQLTDFKKIIYGKFPLKTKKIMVNDYDVVDKKAVKLKLVVVKKFNLFARLAPLKWNLYLSLLINSDFIKTYKTNKYSNYYEYISYKDLKNNKTDAIMRNLIDSIVTKFINSSIDIETKWLEDFSVQINEFIDEKINANYNNFEPQLKTLIKSYCKMKENVRNKNLMITFLQSMWDKVFSLLDLRNNCDCEFNFRKNKKIKKELDYHQHVFSIRKNLKLIDIEISRLRKEIINYNISLRTIKKSINSNIINSYNGELKDRKKILNEFKINEEWKIVRDDQRFEFRVKQEKMFFNLLTDEVDVIRGKIIEIIHNYHKDFINNKVIYGDEQEYLNNKKELFLQKTNLYKYVLNYVKEIFKKLDINVNWFTSNLKFSNLDNLYLSLINGLNRNKNNFVFENVNTFLTREDFKKFIETAKLTVKNYPEVSILFISKKIQDSTSQNENLYISKNNVILETKLENELINNNIKFAKNIFGSSNIFNFNIEEKDYINTIFGKMKIENLNIQNSGTAFLNPFKIKHEKNKNNLHIVGTVNKNNIFYDSNIYLAISKYGSKIYFYSKDKLDYKQKIDLYINQDSIIIYN